MFTGESTVRATRALTALLFATCGLYLLRLQAARVCFGALLGAPCSSGVLLLLVGVGCIRDTVEVHRAMHVGRHGLAVRFPTLREWCFSTSSVTESLERRRVFRTIRHKITTNRNNKHTGCVRSFYPVEPRIRVRDGEVFISPEHSRNAHRAERLPVNRKRELISIMTNVY